MLKWVTVLFTLFILLIIVLANTDALGILGKVNRIPFGDKVGHFLTVSLLLSLLIGLEEWSQSLFPARTMSLSDLTASYAGVTVFALMAYQARE